MNEEVINRISDSIELKEKILNDTEMVSMISDVITVCIYAIGGDHKIWFCGNGGSAADAQHLAAELSGRFYHDREPYFAEALHVNSSYLTAVANDYSFDEVYSRLIKAKARAGDVLIGLSTSGNSINVVKAFEQAQKQEVITVAITGQGGGTVVDFADISLCVPSTDTPRVQEAQMLIGHIICDLIENQLM